MVRITPNPSSPHRVLTPRIVLGLVIGAIFVQYASWRWIFWFLAILAIPAATLCLLLIPAQEGKKDEKANFDFIGVSTLTGEQNLFLESRFILT